MSYRNHYITNFNFRGAESETSPAILEGLDKVKAHLGMTSNLLQVNEKHLETTPATSFSRPYLLT